MGRGHVVAPVQPQVRQPYEDLAACDTLPLLILAYPRTPFQILDSGSWYEGGREDGGTEPAVPNNGREGGKRAGDL